MTHEPGYLIRYGVAGHLGYFLPAAPGAQFHRDTQVVIRSDRGREIGTVLCPAVPETLPTGIPPVPGTVLHPVGPEDRETWDRQCESANAIFTHARAALADRGLPLEIVDAEKVTDPDQVILHVLRLGPVDLADVQSSFEALAGLPVKILDVTNPEALEGGDDCGSCGSGGCSDQKDGAGCSGGTCGSGCGSRKDFPEQWRAYFAELREKMHADLNYRRPIS